MSLAFFLIISNRIVSEILARVILIVCFLSWSTALPLKAEGILSIYFFKSSCSRAWSTSYFTTDLIASISSKISTAFSFDFLYSFSLLLFSSTKIWSGVWVGGFGWDFIFYASSGEDF